MAFDPYLYVALGAGVLAGRFLPHPGRAIPRATVVTVVVLVGLLGASLSPVGPVPLLLTVPLALAFVALLLVLTVALSFLLARPRRVAPPTTRTSPPDRVPLSPVLLAALVGGYGIGRLVPFPAGEALPFALYVLLALVGFDLHLHWRALRGVWVPIAAAAAAAVVSAATVAVASGIPLSVSLATSLAFGWYTLAGPLVAARAGAVLGLLAFLTNFLRENLTMLLSPVVGRRLGGAGLTALGGATAMDTTLYFITRFGDAEAGGVALATGLVLTVSASLLLPLVLAL